MSRIVHTGGIDRDSDAKMNFDTNEKVQVMGTFDSLNLKEDLLRGIYAYSNKNPIIFSYLTFHHLHLHLYFFRL